MHYSILWDINVSVKDGESVGETNRLVQILIESLIELDGFAVRGLIPRLKLSQCYGLFDVEERKDEVLSLWAIGIH